MNLTTHMRQLSRSIVITILLVFPVIAQGQTVHHKSYTTHFNAVSHIPDSVSWDLNIDALTCTIRMKRLNNFRSDPELSLTSFSKAYKNSGYDRGHQMPAEDNRCDSAGMSESFYYSNMVPQTKQLNRITWKALEVSCRRDALKGKVHIISGVIGYKETIGTYRIVVPAYCYKAVYTRGFWTCYIFPNTANVNKYNYSHYLVTVTELNKRTGLKL